MAKSDSTSYRTILRQVGYVLLVVGLVDIVYMIYCIAHRMAYTSSLNIFAVVAGIMLIRGHMGAVKWVTWFTALDLAGTLSIIILFPTLFPPDLLLVEWRSAPVELSIWLVVIPLLLVLMIWIYRRLRSRPVIEARIAAGQDASPPTGAFALGVGVMVVVAVLFNFMQRSEFATKAVELARAQVGSDYKFYVDSLESNKYRVRATVKAYNATQITSVDVEWQRDVAAR